MAQTPELMTIGEFSTRTRLSVRMLRHYDAHGLLIPADVDALTGYRRYSPDQLAQAAHIRRLRDVGFGVSAIAALLAARDRDAYLSTLRIQRETLAQDLAAARQRLTLIDRLLNEENTMSSITITRETIPAMTVVTLRGTVPNYQSEGQLWQRFMPELGRQGIRPVGPGGSIEHDPGFKESEVDESVWLPVAPGTSVEAPLEVLTIPAHEALRAHIHGPYDLIPEAHEQLQAHLLEHGLSRAPRNNNDDPIETKFRNVYLNDPTVTAPEALQHEVILPLP